MLYALEGPDRSAEGIAAEDERMGDLEGAPGVGRATTWAVIGSSVAVLFLDLAIGAVGYLTFW